MNEPAYTAITPAPITPHEELIDPVFDGPRCITLTDGKILTVRPFTFGALTICKKIGLTMFTGEDATPEDEEAMSEATMEQLQAFFWMQTQPIPEVLGAVRDGSWPDRVEEFGFSLPIHEMGNLMKEVNRISELAASAAVDVLPNDEDSDDTPGE